MSVEVEEQDGGAPMETVQSLTLTQDSDGSIILRCAASGTSPSSSSASSSASQHRLFVCVSVCVRAVGESEPHAKKARESADSDASFSLVNMPGE